MCDQAFAETAAAARDEGHAFSADADRLRAILNTIPQMVWSTRPDGHHDFYNDRWYEFTGVPHGSTDGEGWNGMFHPDDQDRAWEVWRASLATGKPYEIEYRLRHHSGGYRWTLGRALPIYGDDGEIVRWFGTCTDIEELRLEREGRELIAAELAHRIKNIFTVISSLVALSSRDHPEARKFAETLMGRITALSRAHDWVGLSEGTGGTEAHNSLFALIEEIVAPYQDAAKRRITLVGSDTALSRPASTALALVLHELATNAVKYGALSVEGGAVVIACDREGDKYLIQWREMGGPVLAGPPRQRGFGTAMARRLAEAQLKASIAEDWQPSGLTVQMEFSAELLAG
jgi:PAS domain S-box-containing protein